MCRYHPCAICGERIKDYFACPEPCWGQLDDDIRAAMNKASRHKDWNTVLGMMAEGTGFYDPLRRRATRDRR